MVLSRSSLIFRQTQTGMLFHCIAYDYSRANWDGFRDHLGEDTFKLSASASSDFCK